MPPAAAPANAAPPAANANAAPSRTRRRRRWPLGALALLGAVGLFTAGVVRLFDLRFSTGDVYPRYSTLRSDPLGTKALFDSLRELPGLRVERNVRPLRYLGEEPSAVLQHRDDDPDPTGNSGPAAVLYLSAGPYQWPFLFDEPETVRLETLMNRGGRVILAFEPTVVRMTGKRLAQIRREERRRLTGEDKDKNAGGKDGDPAKDRAKAKDATGKDKDKPTGGSPTPSATKSPSPSPLPAASPPSPSASPSGSSSTSPPPAPPASPQRPASGSPAPSASSSPSGKPSASPSPSRSPGPTPAKQVDDPSKGSGKSGNAAPSVIPPGSTPSGGVENPDDEEPSPSPDTPPSALQRLAAKQDLVTRWHVDFLRADEQGKLAGHPDAPALADAADVSAVPAPGSPAGLKPVSWHTTIDFDLDRPSTKRAGWHALYTRSRRPVIVQRPFGTAGGELIFVSDPYLFSNEALRREPHPTLLALLIGPCRRIIFDETHLGVAENPGMMTLARRYHLEGALAALAVLALLFLWKNMVSLVPPPIRDPAAGSSPEEGPGGGGGAAAGNFVPGRDSAEGFVNLLRRGVPPADLLKTCLTQWRAGNALPGGRAPNAEVLARVDAIAAAEAARPIHKRSLAAAYRAICAALKRR